MKYDRRTNRFRGFAIIKFKNLASAEKAVGETNFYRIQGKRVSIDYNRPKKSQKSAKQSDKTGDETCWFCYNNKDIERHLIIHSGKFMYIALPKGPVVDHHFLIIPKNHVKSIIELDKESLEEMEYFKLMLIDLIGKDTRIIKEDFTIIRLRLREKLFGV